MATCGKSSFKISQTVSLDTSHSSLDISVAISLDDILGFLTFSAITIAFISVLVFFPLIF